MVRKPGEKAVAAALSLFTLLGPVTPCLTAKTRLEEQRASVIAHLPVPGSPVHQMFLGGQKGKRYLYIQQVGKETYTVVDVSKPERPVVLDTASAPNKKAGQEKVELVGDGLALAETPDSSGGSNARHELAPIKAQSATASSRPTESVRVLDLSDPKNPRTLQTFNGVTSILAEDGRGLIYIANGQGLWILRHRDKHELPPCTTGDAFSAIADCQ